MTYSFVVAIVSSTHLLFSYTHVKTFQVKQTSVSASLTQFMLTSFCPSVCPSRPTFLLCDPR